MAFRNVDAGDCGRKVGESNFERNGMIFASSKAFSYIFGTGYEKAMPYLVINPNVPG